MYFEIKPLAKALAVACGGFACATLSVAPAIAQQTPQRLDRVEITGSAIKRTDVETSQPVEIYTRKEIERTGATNVNELLRSIPSIDIFDQGELASNSPAGSGTANIAMRGLSSSNVLVLLNGRRLPVNALYDSSGAGAAVDINTIPISAIDRIEILKDGGSAIYGADAVAGVFNIITRKDYQGIEARAGYGVSRYGDGDEYNVGLAAGFGDLAKDRYNVFVGLDYFKRDPIFRKDRDISRSVDFRRFGSQDARSSFSPFGNILDPETGGFANVPYRACPADLQNPPGRCRYDFNSSILTAYNGAERWSGMGMVNFQLTPTVRAFGEAMYTKTKDTFEAHPVPDFFFVPITDPVTQGAFRSDIDGFPDPTSNSIYIAGRFLQGGPRTTDREATLLNLATGLEGTNFGLDWKLSVGHGISEVTNRDRNYYNADLWFDATTSGALDPTVNTNNPAFVESLKVTPFRKGTSTLSYVNGQISGEMFNLPAGPLAYAVGAQYWKESLEDTPDALTQAGDVVGSIAQAAVDADRNIYAAFLELSVPILRTLEGRAAVRYDHYPSESQVSPMFGLRWQALPNLMFRTTYTQSFRAPVLKQLFGAQEQGAININTPERCVLVGLAPTCNVPAFQVNGSNPDLTAETAETYSVGVVGDLGVFSGSVDWWRIVKEDVISQPTITTALEQGLFRREQGRLLVFTNLQNIANTANSGVDVDFRVRVPGTGVGTVTFRNLLTYFLDVSTKGVGEDWAQFLATYAIPRWRNVFIADLQTGPWLFRALHRSVSGFADTDDPAPVAPGTRKVSAYGELDVLAEYEGFRNLTLTAGVKNLTNRQPPFSLTNATDNLYTQMGFAELYTNRGRFMYVNATYRFR